MSARAYRPRRRYRYRSRRRVDAGEALGVTAVVIGSFGVVMCGVFTFGPPLVPGLRWPDLPRAAIVGGFLCSALLVAVGVMAILWTRSRAEEQTTSPRATTSSASEWRQMEASVCAWLQSIGEPDARVGSGTHDGGIDVESSRYVVQVKHWQANVGAPAVRQIAGVAFSRGKQGVVVAKTGYTRDALAFADQGNVALFEYSTGALRPLNHHAQSMLDRPRRTR